MKSEALRQDTPEDAAGTEQKAQRWGFTPEELATYPTVYRSDLLAGKRVLVTGGGTGIGQGIALLCARLGAEVVICGRTLEKLAATVDIARDHLDIKILTHTCNIRELDDVEGIMDYLFDELGGLDILVNNAGGQFPQAALDLSPRGWRAVIDLNLNGTWNMMQAAAQRWVRQGKPGSIVNIVANVERGMPQVAHTCAARAGVIYLSKTVSTEWAEHEIRVNCVAPGSIESTGFEVYPEGVPDELFRTSNPMMRLGDVFDVAESVVYLGGASGKFITGEMITVDGGMQQWGNCWPGGRPDRFSV